MDAVGSVTAGLLALNVAPSWGFTAPATLASGRPQRPGRGGASSSTSGGPPTRSSRSRYFRMRNFVFPLGARAFVNFSYMGGFFLFPILMERVYGYSETRAGLVSTARPLMFSLVAPIAGYAAVKVGERLLGGGRGRGPVVSMLVFTQLGAEPSLVVIVVALALSGVGNGLSTPSTASSASNEVAADELGVMSAAQQLITQIGIVAGIQVMVTVQASAHGGVGLPGLVPPGLRGRGRGRRRWPGCAASSCATPRGTGGRAGGRPGRRAPPGLSWTAYSVMARMRAAISAADGSGAADWRAISLAMSPRP